MFKKRVAAFGHAFRGIGYFFRESIHAQIHLVATVLVVALGFYVDLSMQEWVAIILCIGLVLSFEAMNSALEYLTDLASPQFHELAKKAKDVSAASVLISAAISVIIALIIFGPKLI